MLVSPTRGVPIRDFGGPGSPVVILNGSGSPVEHIIPLARALSQAHRVLIPIYPGYEGTPPVDGGYSLDAERRLVENALLEMGIGAAALVGFSLGGYRALSLACSGRVRVTRLAVLAGFASLPPADRALFRAFAEMVRTDRVPSAALAQRFLSDAYAAKHPERCDEISRWLGSIDSTALAVELDAVAACQELGLQVCTIGVPMLLRVGALDLAAPTARSEEIAKCVPQSRLEIVAGAGHLLLFEDFDETVTSVLRALSPAGD